MKIAGNYTAIIFLATVMSIFGLSIDAKRPIGQYLFEQIIIKGTTNVNRFEILYKDSEFSYFATKDTAKNSNLKIPLPTGRFIASPDAMLKDFLKLIEAKNYPNIYITIKNNLAKDFFKSDYVISPKIEVSIKGISNEYKCNSELKHTYYNEWYFNGVLKVRLSDFDIDPPEKFLGLIRVKDELQINFKILFVLDE